MNVSLRHALFLVLSGVSGCELPPSQTDARLTRTGELVTLSGGGSGAENACFTCHGMEGQGDGGGVPRLAGLAAGYLQKQMQDYADDVRHHDVMSTIARRMDADSRRDVALYYSSLPAPAIVSRVQPTPAVWTRGDPAQNVPACSTCHGMNGEGVGSGNPAVSSQPADYTIDQLMRWKRAERRNDPRNVMTRAVANLGPTEIAAIALWLETRPAAPAPGTDAASVSAAAEAGAESVTSRGPRRLDR